MVDPESQTCPRAFVEENPLAGTPYHLLRYVAAGTVGAIAEAEHVALRRTVIVKLIRRAYASLPGFVDRLRLEAQALAVLEARTHHILAMLDLGETRDVRNRGDSVSWKLYKRSTSSSARSSSLMISTGSP